MVVTVTRESRSDEGTFGHLTTDVFTCHTGELPWRDNHSGKSCIPVGAYECRWAYSAHLGHDCYHVTNVPHREGILIHSANYMGDVDKGLRAQVSGCIALGNSIGILNTQRAILGSKKTIAAFEALLDKKPFTLVIG